MPVSNARPETPLVEIYCDESYDRGGFDLFGGIWAPRPRADKLREIVAELRRRHSFPYELKYKKATGATLSPMYRDLAAKVTDQIRSSRIQFNCIVIPRRVVDVDAYHDGDHELKYYKFASLLFRKRITPGRSYVATFDHRSTRLPTRLSTLRDVMNACGRRDNDLGYDCFRDVQARPSKADDLLQVADILLGSVGFHWAGGHLDPNTSLAKNDLADRIARGIRKPNLTFTSPATESRFNIWLWNPGPQKNSPPGPSHPK